MRNLERQKIRREAWPKRREHSRPAQTAFQRAFEHK
jgi:hypothetical protein